MSELEIPDAAIDAADIFGGQIRRPDLRDQLERAAPLIVATELRSLLAELESGRCGSTSAMVACVRRRIGALDKQGGQ